MNKTLKLAGIDLNYQQPTAALRRRQLVSGSHSRFVWQNAVYAYPMQARGRTVWDAAAANALSRRRQNLVGSRQ